MHIVNNVNSVDSDVYINLLPSCIYYFKGTVKWAIFFCKDRWGGARGLTVNSQGKFLPSANLAILNYLMQE